MLVSSGRGTHPQLEWERGREWTPALEGRRGREWTPALEGRRGREEERWRKLDLSPPLQERENRVA